VAEDEKLSPRGRPGTATLYTQAIDPKIIVKLHLRADAEGNVEFRRRFWTFPGEKPRLTPTLWSTPISWRPAMLVVSRLRNSYVARSSLDLADRGGDLPRGPGLDPSVDL
jgi:hypothetical protein